MTVVTPNAFASSQDTVSVMIGSLFNFTDLLEMSIADPLLASGGVGLDGMGYAITALTLQGTGLVPQFARIWSGTGSGTQEETAASGTSEGTITVLNTTSAAIYIPVEGAMFSTSSGTGFQAVGDVHVGNWALGNSGTGLGSYKAAPGTSITIPVQSLQYAQGAAANTITQSSIAGLSVTASTPMAASASWTNPADNNQSGFLTSAYGQYGTIFTGQGLSPAESQVNVDGSHEWTTNDLQAWEGYVDNCRSVGILNVAPIMGDNSYTADLTQPFATSSWYANLRAAALYSGGLAFDLPPDYWFGRTFDNYQQNIIEQIRWCDQMGLRSDLIIGSTPQNGQPDTAYLSQTMRLLDTLQAADALPSQVVVENYVDPIQPNFYDANPADVNSMNAVALAVAGRGIGSPTPSEAGLEVKGTSTAQTTLIMTGVRPTEDYTQTATFNPYSVTEIHGVDPTRALTLTVQDTSGLLSLSDRVTNQSVTAGGTLTFNGTPDQATAFLDDLVATAATGAAGTAELQLTLTDYLGQVTAGMTAVSVGHTHPLFTSIGETPSVGGTLHVGATVTYAVALSEAVTITGQPTLLLSNLRIATYTGINPAGKLLFTYTVAAGDDTQDLKVRALQMNGSTITDSAGLPINPDQLDNVPGMTNSFTVDTQNAQVTAVTETSTSATLGANSTVTFTIASALPLVVTAGSAPTLTLTDGGIATYTGLTAGGALAFTYSVPTGGYSAALAPTTLNLNGAAITDSAGEPFVTPWTMPTPLGGDLVYNTQAITTPLDTVTFFFSENAYEGNAVALLSIDGQQVEAPVILTAAAAAQESQAVTVTGDFSGGGVHTASVAFANPLTGATEGQRAVFFGGLSFDGRFQDQPAILTGSQADTFTIATTPDDLLQVWVSEDAYIGNAQFITFVDGKLVGGTYAATTLHSSGQWQEVDIYGQFGVGSHNVRVMFTNDAHGSSPSEDRNLYVNQIALDGVVVPVTGNLLSTYASVTANFAAPTDTLTLDVSENAWIGDAQFYITVDGKQVGGLQTVTASNAASASQAITVQGTFAAGVQTVGLTFINAASGGTAATTRSLYLTGAVYDGTKVNIAQTLTTDSTVTFAVDNQQAQITQVTETGSAPVLAAGGSVSFDIGSNLPLLVPPNAAPTLTLSDGGTATYTGLTSSGALSFTYNLPTGGSSAALAPTALNLNGASITNSAGQALVTPYVMPAPTSGDLSYNASTAAPPLDTVTFYLGEQAYEGDAVALLTINGQQIGGPVTVMASANTGLFQAVTLTGDFGGGDAVTAGVTLENGLKGAEAGKRALYLSGASFDGQFQNQPTILTGPQPDNFIIASKPDDLLQVWVSEDAYLGNAQFVVSVDGKRVGENYSATVLHSSGQWQEVDIQGQFGTGSHSVNVMFVNDANGGSPGEDRNLYVNQVAINGVTVSDNAALLSTYGNTTAIVPAPADNLTLDISETAWVGDAQFYVTVDGRQIGGLQTATASHASGSSEAVTLQGSFGSGVHTVGMTFINAASAGTSATTRSLFLNGVIYDGRAVAATHSFSSDETDTFQVGQTAPNASAVISAAMTEASDSLIAAHQKTAALLARTDSIVAPPTSGSLMPSSHNYFQSGVLHPALANS